MLIRKTSQPVFWKSVVHGMIIGHKGWPFGTGWDGGPSDAHTSTKHVVSESSVTCVSCLTHTQHHVHLGVDKSKERWFFKAQDKRLRAHKQGVRDKYQPGSEAAVS
eukprot:1161761-Pelagomonas_calceolata.AAC.13